MAKKLRTILCMALSIAMFSSCALLPEEEVLPPPIIPRVEITLRTETVARGDIIDYVRVSGRAVSVNQHNIYLGFDIPSAVLIERGVDPENLRVQAGDTLAVFASDDLEAQITPLTRTLELAQINYDAAFRTLESQRIYYEEIKNRTERIREGRTESERIELDRLKTRIDDAARRYETDRILFELGIVSQDTLSNLERVLRDLEDELENLEALQARNRLTQDAQLEQDIRIARASAENDTALRRERLNLTAAQQNLADIQERSERFVLRAPTDGLITYFAELFIGDTYRYNQRLFTIADDTSLFVSAIVPEIQRHRFAPGNHVELTASVLVGDERQTIEFEGSVISISTDQRRAALLDDDMIVIEAANWPEEVKLGDLIWIYLIRARVYDVVTIPVNALNTIGSFNFVRVAEDGISRERPVEIGIQSSTMVEIVHGLAPGEEIVVR
ncbi:MAG: efflux RND transporter periplasmic adaptor subunit [Defluviitaleaceae bacterium]|nr:efflux RND transporter periplasmic adaptor subunit [Defluviitaleaceae bacterium]